MKLPGFTLLLTALLLLAGAAQAQLYTIGQGVTTHDRRDREALVVRVDGSVETTRDFWQDYLKNNYSVRFKSSALATLGIKGQRGNLAAQQVTGMGISSRPVDLYVNLTAINDSTTEVAFFGGFGDKTYFTPAGTAPEWRGLTTVLERFAAAARPNAYQAQVKEAENNVAAAEKERDKLARSIQSAQSNTASNLKRIDELTNRNRSNALQMHSDSLQLTTNAQLREVSSQRLQRRRERLTSATRK